MADRTKLIFRLFPQSWEAVAPILWCEQGIDRVWRNVAWLCLLVTEASALFLRRALQPAGTALAERARQSLREASFLYVSLLILLAIYLVDLFIVKIGYFPETLQVSIREPIDNVVKALVADPNFAAFSKWLRGAIFNWLLNPLNQFLVGLPGSTCLPRCSSWPGGQEGWSSPRSRRRSCSSWRWPASGKSPWRRCPPP